MVEPKPQIWEGSFREKSKSFEKRLKNPKFDFSKSQKLLSRKLGRNFLCMGASQNPFYPVKPKTLIFQSSFREKSKSFKND